jgi:hypothetical protein
MTLITEGRRKMWTRIDTRTDLYNFSPYLICTFIRALATHIAKISDPRPFHLQFLWHEGVQEAIGLLSRVDYMD